MVGAEHRQAEPMKDQPMAPGAEAKIVVDRLVIEPQRRQEEHEGTGQRRQPQGFGCKPPRAEQPRRDVKAFEEAVAAAHGHQVAPFDAAQQLAMAIRRHVSNSRPVRQMPAQAAEVKISPKPVAGSCGQTPKTRARAAPAAAPTSHQIAGSRASSKWVARVDISAFPSRIGTRPKTPPTRIAGIRTAANWARAAGSTMSGSGSFRYAPAAQVLVRKRGPAEASASRGAALPGLEGLMSIPTRKGPFPPRKGRGAQAPPPWSFAHGCLLS